MNENVIRFPGYLEGTEGWWHGGKLYATFKALVRDLSERERERTKQWHVKREGRANYRAAVLFAGDRLEPCYQGGGSAA